MTQYEEQEVTMLAGEATHSEVVEDVAFPQVAEDPVQSAVADATTRLVETQEALLPVNAQQVMPVQPVENVEDVVPVLATRTSLFLKLCILMPRILLLPRWMLLSQLISLFRLNMTLV
jgi:hypothetical protein